MSLKRSLILAFAGLLTLLSILSAGFSYISARTEAWDMMDTQQRQIARFVGSGSELKGTLKDPAIYDPEDSFVVEIIHNDGTPTVISEPKTMLPQTIEPEFSTFENTDGQWRLYTLVTDKRTIRVAQQLSVRNEIAAESALGAALPFLFAIPLSWLIATGLVAAIIKQLTGVAQKVEQRSVGDTTPIDIEDVPLEAQPLITAMNGALARVEAAREQQSIFLANAAHELRTPLAAITLQIGNLKRIVKDVATAERVADVEAGAKRAAALTDQLLKLARQDANTRPLERKPVSLDSLITGVTSGLSTLAQSRSVTLAFCLHESVMVNGDAVDFHVLVETLIDNAVRYTPMGSTVDVGLSTQNQRAVITISDTGPGIPPEHLSRVFERFYRAALQDQSGSGLGLSIAKLIADRHKIEITLANRIGQSGLEAKLIFPVDQNFKT
jgi:two-component system, OmpR family, sensor kinase